MQIVCTIEPGVIALGLRHDRMKLTHEINRLWGKDMVGGEECPGAAVALSKLIASKLQVCEMILRLARVPHAPAGSKASGKVTLPLDLSPDPVDAPEITPSESSPSEQHAPSDSVPT